MRANVGPMRAILLGGFVLCAACGGSTSAGTGAGAADARPAEDGAIDGTVGDDGAATTDASADASGAPGEGGQEEFRFGSPRLQRTAGHGGRRQSPKAMRRGTPGDAGRRHAWAWSPHPAPCARQGSIAHMARPSARACVGHFGQCCPAAQPTQGDTCATGVRAVQCDYGTTGCVCTQGQSVLRDVPGAALPKRKRDGVHIEGALLRLRRRRRVPLHGGRYEHRVALQFALPDDAALARRDMQHAGNHAVCVWGDYVRVCARAILLQLTKP